MIRCDLLGPDGDGRLLLEGGALASLFKIRGCRTPPSPADWAAFVRDAAPNYASAFQVSWLQHPGAPPRAAQGATPLALLLDAKQSLAEAGASGSMWLGLLNASTEADARARQSRHEAGVERLAAHPWLALQRLNAAECLKLTAAFAGMREAHTAQWDPGANPGLWFQPGRTDNCLQLGRYWWAPVCMVQGPAEHRGWAEFIPPDAPCWLSMRISGDAHKRFQARASAAGWLANAGNRQIAEASRELYALPAREAVAVSLTGLAAGGSPGEARAAAEQLAAQLEAWLGGRISPQASALSVLSTCIPGFVGFAGRQPPAWPATNAQAGMLLPVLRPASPWPDPADRALRPFSRTSPAASFRTAAGAEPPAGYPYDPFGEQPTYVTLISGKSGGGKSMALSNIALDFTRQHPRAPVRILDAGGSAAPLADIWKQEGRSVAQPDLRGLPPVNLLQPPFPLLRGGPLQASAAMTLLNILIPEFTARRPALAARALDLAWGMAREGVLPNADPRPVEDAFARGDLQGAREAHAAAAPTLRDLALLFASPAMAGPARNDPDADYLNRAITEVTGNHPNLVRAVPPEWMAASRMVADLGGQALMDDPMTPVRYTLGLSLLTGDLAANDWRLDSAPGPASEEYARETARALTSQPKLVICDEMHRLQGNETAETWIERIAREGRKAYLGMLLASQEASDFAAKIVNQASVRMAFGNDPTAPEHFGLHPGTLRAGAGNAALYARDAAGLRYQAALRLELAPEHLWALGSGARERELVRALSRARGSRAEALRELAGRLPGGRLPPDAAPPEELARVWTEQQ